MITTNYLNDFNSPMRQIKGKVGLYSSTNAEPIEYTYQDYLKSFTVERTGEQGKFFGFGVVHKLNIDLVDTKREVSVFKGDIIKAWLGIGENEYISPYPNFYIDEPKRDEKTNELKVVCYDVLGAASAHTVSELELEAPYTIKQFAEACAVLLGVGFAETANSSFDLSYEDGANFEGTETIREALDAIAEATQTIYYIGRDNNLEFIRLDKDSEPVLTIDNSIYMEFNSKTNVILSNVAHVTDLGDNLATTSATNGVTQYVRNNPFWELREDITTLLENALAATSGTSIYQFDCSWRGNFLLDIGDKIGLITKDNETIISYVLDDVITYNGGLSEKTQWKYEAEKGESSNPTSLGEAIKETYAKVDKANKQIDIVASETSANSDAIAVLQINTESINASVEKIEKNSAENLETINNSLATLTERVEAQITAEDLTIEIQKELANGSTKVETTTGFAFNEEGLSISKSGSEISTTITEDGMAVTKNNEEVLKADNEGVKAIDLHATTYLVIGTNSRFEDYGSNRTGCFWIGGNF